MSKSAWDDGFVNVWWVNQNRSYETESAGNYLWAPTGDRRGHLVHHYESLTEVRPGDFVLHYANQHVRAVSIVQEKATPAVCPRPDDRRYRGREGRLVRTHYNELPTPVPLADATNVSLLPMRLRPFDRSGGTNEGYLFQYGEAAFVELVMSLDIEWPVEVVHFVADRWPVRIPTKEPLLYEFVQQLCHLNVSIHNGMRRLYKPLLLLAGIRSLLADEPLTYQGPMQRHYARFVDVLGAGTSDPSLPYFHLTTDHVWSIVDEQGRLQVFEGRPRGGRLKGTRAQFRTEMEQFIHDRKWRPYVLRALSTHFSRPQWERLMSEWPELASVSKVSLAWKSEVTDHPMEAASTQTVRQPFNPATMASLHSVVDHFSQALRDNHLRFGADHEDFVRRFVASLATKPFMILTGLSGSGKTQIARQFGHWVGGERLLVVPVRPDWTGSDALFGYEDALRPLADDGRRAWHVPASLRFMLEAARDPDKPYVLVLDEMNLAHVERYFADVLSGMESGEPTLPNLAEEADGHWRIVPGAPVTIPVPANLFIIGTVNVDETTYMFSPKVLDRANTLEFRVETDDLDVAARKPTRCAPGPDALVDSFLTVATDADFHSQWPHPAQDDVAGHLRRLHRLLYDAGFEFGHRVFWESLRFAAMMAAAGQDDVHKTLDAIVLQKVMPRLHGNRRRLEPMLETLGYFCYGLPDLDGEFLIEAAVRFDPLDPPPQDSGPRLPLSFTKIQRMTRNVRANQFASFAE